MKKYTICLFAFFALIVFNGCVQINSSDGGSMNILPSTVGPTDKYRPLYTVDESKKVTASSDVKNLFWIFTWGSDNAYADNAHISDANLFGLLGKIFPFLNAKETACKAAFYKACKNSGCDSLVAARYECKFEDYLIFKKMTVEVKGFPAKLSGVETVKPMPYYIDGDGKVVITDKFVLPYLLFDGRKAKSDANSSGMGVFSFLNNILR